MHDDQESIGELTRLIARAGRGDDGARDALVASVYRQLQRTAGEMVKRQPQGLTLKATEVVHEAYFRLFRHQAATWEGRRHFFGSASNAMRQVLVEHARRKRAGKRIPPSELVTLDEDDSFEVPNLDLLALDRALDKLMEVSPRQAQVVEMRFFGGLTEQEIAELLGVSRMTISREWQVARLRLWREIAGSSGATEPPG
ncbi:MAG: ECF-type sigma factor [Acidobacteriota bacterium]